MLPEGVGIIKIWTSKKIVELSIRSVIEHSWQTFSLNHIPISLAALMKAVLLVNDVDCGG